MGRRTKLTPELHERIVAAIRAGATLEAAAGAAGIGEATLYRWLQEGESDSAPAPFREFREEVYRAREELEVRLVAGSVMKDALGGTVVKETERVRPDGTVERERQVTGPNGRLALELLARRFPDRYGKRLEVTGAGGGPVQVAHGAVIASLAERLEAELGGGVVRGELEEGE